MPAIDVLKTSSQTLASVIITSTLTINDDASIVFGTDSDAALGWTTNDGDNHTLVLSLGNSNQSLHITDYGARTIDWAVAAVTHPTVFIHSDTTPATDYVTIGGHDGTTAAIDVVGGTTFDIRIGGTDEIQITASTVTIPNAGLTVAGNITSSSSLQIAGTDVIDSLRQIVNITNATIDNVNVNGNTVSSTSGQLIFTATTTITAIGQTWASLGTVTTVDINGGTVDGVTIGGASAGAGTFTTLNATGGGALTGTWTNLGSVTTIDINGGTVDGVTINNSVIGGVTPAAITGTTVDATTDFTVGNTVITSGQVATSSGNLTLAANSGDDVLIGDGTTLLRVDGGAQSIAIGDGATADANSMVRIAGTFNSSGADASRAFVTRPTINVVADQKGMMLDIGGTLVEAATGTHSLFSAVHLVGPTITAGGATVTNTATLYIKDAPSATVTGANYAFWVDSGLNRFDGSVLIGDTTEHGAMGQGLVVNQGSNDDNILALKSSDINHGLTTAVTGTVETDDIATFSKRHSVYGGLRLQSLAADFAGISPSMLIEVYGGTAATDKTTTAGAMMQIDMFEHNGSNALANITADGNIFAVRGYVGGSLVARMVVDEDGDLYISGSIKNFTDLSGITLETSAGNIVLNPTTNLTRVLGAIATGSEDPTSADGTGLLIDHAVTGISDAQIRLLDSGSASEASIYHLSTGVTVIANHGTDNVDDGSFAILSPSGASTDLALWSVGGTGQIGIVKDVANAAYYFRSNTATEIGYSVTNANFTVGSLGTIVAPYRSSTAAAFSDALAGNANGAFGFNYDSDTGPTSTLEARMNGGWVSVSLGGTLFPAKRQFSLESGALYHPDQIFHAESWDAGSGSHLDTYMDESLCSLCGVKIEPGQVAVFFTNHIRTNGDSHAVYAHFDCALESSSTVKELRKGLENDKH